MAYTLSMGHRLIILQEIKKGKSVEVNLKAELGFMNEKVPSEFNSRHIYVCFLAERSDGHLIDFRRFR